MPCIWHRWGEWEEYEVLRRVREIPENNGICVAHVMTWRRHRSCLRCSEKRDQMLRVVKNQIFHVINWNAGGEDEIK